MIAYFCPLFFFATGRLNDPQRVRAMFDPANIQAMLQIQRGMAQLQASGLGAGLGGGAPGGAPGAAANNPFLAAMLGQVPGATTTTATPATATNNDSTAASPQAGAPAAAPAAGAAGVPDLNALMRQMMLGGGGGLFGGGLGAPPAAAAAAPALPPAERFADQLQQLNAMGFADAQRNLDALTQTNGNVSMAVERLLQ